MGALSVWHLLVLAVVGFVLFGAGKFPRAMADLARGLRSFRRELRDEDQPQITGRG